MVRFQIISKIIKEKEYNDFSQVRAISDGVSLNSSTLCYDEVDLQSIALNSLFSNYPIFTPLIGVNLDKIEQLKNNISRNLNKSNYCAFKPRNQQIIEEDVKNLYKLLKLDNLIEETLQKLEEITINR